MASADLVCVRCREKKIRCGREKGQCANCRRDGVECNYSTPGKRVNHIKLLCSNISNLQDRLSNIEGGLASVISIVNSHDSPFISSGTRSETKTLPNIDDNPLQRDESMTSKENEQTQPPDGHIIRDLHTQTDRYHGPGTLLTLCHQFRKTITEHLSDLEANPVRDTIEQRMNSMCWEAGNEEHIFPEKPDSTPIPLPPKRLIRVLEMQFFQQSHYAADLFVPSRFRAKVEELYSRPFIADDEVWAICLHIIILLVLGPDDDEMGDQSQLHSPTFLTLQSALANSSISMIPRMINLQTLALISNFAQQYFPLSVAKLAHAQACILAKIMGLHQPIRQEQMDFSPQEIEERTKAVRCLYIQSMGFGISRGSICWFSSFESPSMRELMFSTNDRQILARLQLAEIQESLCRLIYTGLSSPQNQHSLIEIVGHLDRWAMEYRLFDPAQLSDSSTMDLRYDFFSTRTVASSRSLKAAHYSQAVFDARITCAMLLVACSNCDPVTAERLAPTNSQQSPSSHPLGQLRPDLSTAPLYPDLSSSDLPQLSSQSIIERFPTAAIFVLATTLATSEPRSRAEDRELIQRVSSYYLDLGNRLPQGNHILKIGRIFQIMLDSLQLLSTPELSTLLTITPVPDDDDVEQGNGINIQSQPHDSMSEPMTLDLSALSSPVIQTHSRKPSQSGTQSPSTGAMSLVTSAAENPQENLWMMPFMQFPDARRPSRKRRLLDERDMYFSLGEDTTVAPLPDFGLGVGGNTAWP